MTKNHKNIIQMQLMKFEFFKSQNPETGRFDVIFEIEGKILYAHKTMLILESDTFDSMLSERWTLNKDDPVKIKTYSYDNFYQLLTFLYSGECELTEKNIYSMVDMAEFYGIDIFKTYCDEFLAVMKITAENVFQLMNLSETYSMVQLKAASHGFITNNLQSFSGSDGFLKAEKPFIEGVITAVMDEIKPEDLFEAVYKWSKKQAIDKQAADPTLNLNDAIKVEISAFLPHISFRKMDFEFFCEFVVSRGHIFSSFNELSRILCQRFDLKVKITNSYGQVLHGKLKCDNVFIKAIKTLKSASSVNGTDKHNWWKCNNIVSNQSPLKKREGVEWYLIYYPGGGFIGYVHRSINYPNEYLLAELTAETFDFKATRGSKIEID